MDERQRRIIEDLSGLLKGELRCDPLTVSMYASDGSLYQILPLGVAYPRDRNDVVTLALKRLCDADKVDSARQGRAVHWFLPGGGPGG